MNDNLEKNQEWQHIGNEISAVLQNNIKLKYVLCCYQNTNDSQYYEMAQTRFGRLGTFMPLTIKYMDDYARKIISSIKSVTEKSRLQENIDPFPFPLLYISKNLKTFLFTEEGMPDRIVYYKGKRKKLIGIPKLYYLVEDNSLKVMEKIEGCYYAFNMPNISSTGSVCLGNSLKVKSDSTLNELMKQFHAAFWESSFNSHSDSTKFDWTKRTLIYEPRKNTKPCTL